MSIERDELEAKRLQRGATSFRRAEHRQRVVTIEWDSTAEWHVDGESGFGCWYIWDEESVCPYARQRDVQKALQYAGQLMHGAGEGHG